MSEKPTYEELEQRVLELEKASSERNAAKRALEENEERLSTIYNASGDISFLLDVKSDGEYIFNTVNPAFLSATGLPAKSVVGKNVREVIPTPSLDLALGYYMQAVEEKTIVRWEETSEYPTGKRTALVSVVPVIAADGTCQQLVGSVHDITERKQAEKELQSSENLYRTILQTAMNGFWLTDTNGSFLEVNDAYAQMSGYSIDELKSMRIADVEANEDPDEVARHIQKGIETGSERFETRHRRKDGSIYDVEVRFRYLPIDGGRFVVFVSDLTERKKATEELRLQSQAMDNMLEGVHIVDTDSRVFVYTNRAFDEMLGYGKDELIGKHVSIINPPTDRSPEQAAERIISTVDRDGSWEGEVENIRKDGTIILSRARVSAFEHSQQGSLLITAQEDISERKQVEKELDRIFKLTPDLIGVADANRQVFTQVNPAWEKILGRPIEEFLSRPFMEFVHPDDHSATSQEIDGQLSGEPVFRFVNRYRRKDGSYATIEWHATAAQEDGTVYATGRDITERKQAEENLHRLNSRLESLWNMTKIADAEIKTICDHVLMEIQSMTESEYAFFGFLTEDEKTMVLHAWSNETMDNCQVADKPLHFAVEDAGIWAEAIRARQTLTLNDFSLDLPGKKGLPEGHVPVNRLMAVPLVVGDKVISIAAVANKQTEYTTEDENQIHAFLANVQFLFDRKLAEEDKAELQKQLQQAQKMEAIGTLAGGIAHDFNNILGIIMGCTELSLHELSEEATIHEHLAESLKATNRAKDLVKQILTFSRQGEGDRKPLAIAIIIKEALKMLRATLPSTIEIKQDIRKDSGLVNADPTQIHQIIMNTATNASHAMAETGGLLSVSLTGVEIGDQSAENTPVLKPGSYVKLTISDTGQGMEPEVLERIFEPYYTTKGLSEGTGLGLSVVHGIVRGHDGTIDVSSVPGEGTTFDILLPKVDRTMEQPPVREPENLPTGRERILFVDDEPPMVNIYKNMLERLGYTVSARTSSLEALEAFRAQPDGYDIIITDQTMPNLTGEILAKEMMAIRPDIPVILCTGHSDSVDEIRTQSLGIRDFIMKPIAMEEIARAIRNALDQRRKSEE